VVAHPADRSEEQGEVAAGEDLGVLDGEKLDVVLDCPQHDLDQMPCLLGVTAGESVGVLDDQGALAQLLTVLHCASESGAAVAAKRGCGLVMVFGHDFAAFGLGELAAVLKLIGDRAFEVGGGLGARR
jgi:hypothetical protein